MVVEGSCKFMYAAVSIAGAAAVVQLMGQENSEDSFMLIHEASCQIDFTMQKSFMLIFYTTAFL